MFKIDSFKKVIFGGIILGFLIHAILVSTAYFNLKLKIENSRFSSLVFKDDPSIGILFSLKNKDNEDFSDGRNLDSKIVWRLLVNINVLDWSSTQDDISKRLRRALESQLSSISIANVTTIDHLIYLSQNLGSQPQEKQNDKELENLIAACLANGPNAFNDYKDAVQSQSSFTYFENPIAFLLPRQLNPWAWGDKCNQEQVVNLLFIHTRLAPDFDDLPDAVSNSASTESLEPTQVYRQINEYFQRIFISIHDDPGVLFAKNWYTIVEGPEQFFMYIVFSIGIFILIMHNQQQKKKINLSIRQERFSIIFYRWIQIALPSLGFIGTKRGLSEALGRADSIVRAGSPINQAIAVSNVSETMGVAFTSTLVGLILLMILMVCELYLKYQNVDWNEQAAK